MKTIRFLTGAGIVTALLGAPSIAAELAVEIELPELAVAEYHRPYVAIWVARPDHSVAANLNVWYQLEDGPEGEGETWLKDMRQWWRRTGRSLDMPVDGVSSPTRAPGSHKVVFDAERLGDLAPGEYVLHVEAAREVGGRELVRIPFSLNETSDQAVEGETELGRVSLKVTR